jgi:hypothetical protein
MTSHGLDLDEIKRRDDTEGFSLTPYRDIAEASVAGRLLQSGIASVAAMSHSVLVETARRFTEAFLSRARPGRARGGSDAGRAA